MERGALAPKAHERKRRNAICNEREMTTFSQQIIGRFRDMELPESRTACVDAYCDLN
jgi:hypothetical protein